MSLCKICNGFVFNGLYLANGKVVHASCLKSIQQKELDNRIEVNTFQKTERLVHKKNKFEGLIFKVMSIFFRPDVNIV